jgi:hypothetical protein
MRLCECSGHIVATPSLHVVISISKRILNFAADLLLGSRDKAQSNELNIGPSPTNSYQATPPPSTSRTHLRKERSSSSNLPAPCRLEFRPAYDMQFRSSNDTYEGDKYKKSASLFHSCDVRLVKNPTSILPGPPKGWENIFQPKDGEWKCKTCFYINPSKARTCDSCTRSFDEYYITQSHSLRQI